MGRIIEVNVPGEVFQLNIVPRKEKSFGADERMQLLIDAHENGQEIDHDDLIRFDEMGRRQGLGYRESFKQAVALSVRVDWAEVDADLGITQQEAK